MFALLLGCAEGVPTLGAQVQVVPGPGLPAEVEVQAANNNLDVVEHGGALYLAFRTAPDHFASAEARLVVLRSEDRQSWSLETSVFLGTDLREPRLLSWDGQLFLYYAELGSDPLAFEPQGSWVTVRGAAGGWSAPEPIFDVGFIPWRVRVLAGQPVLVGYTGGEQIYTSDEGTPQLEVQLLRSDDGLAWEALVPGQPVVHTGGGSETDIGVLRDGALVAVLRNEAGEPEGFGSKICRAEAGAWGDWRCVHDVRKYDSPLVIVHEDRVWLLARRNVTDTGAFDLGREDLDFEAAYYHYQVSYWQEPKRCALWEVDPEALTVAWVLDLPSRGDTCFPAALERGEGVFEVWNYSSDPEGPDLSWLEGQKGPTAIFRQDLILP